MAGAQVPAVSVFAFLGATLKFFYGKSIYERRKPFLLSSVHAVPEESKSGVVIALSLSQTLWHESYLIIGAAHSGHRANRDPSRGVTAQSVVGAALE